MTQRYKIYVNDKAVTLVPSTQAAASAVEKNILLAIKALETDDALDELLVAVPANWHTIVDSFSLLKYIEAAGGVVRNEKEEYLFMRRLDKWDLPKGKLEEGETIETCAVREVEEECGIKVDRVIGTLKPSFHFYYDKQVPIIKITHWYLMEASSKQKITPQLEENITEVRWANTDTVSILLKDSYLAITDVMEDVFTLNKV